MMYRIKNILRNLRTFDMFLLVVILVITFIISNKISQKLVKKFSAKKDKSFSEEHMSVLADEYV